MARRLLLLNGVAIVCVILFHATGYGFTAMFSWAHRYRDVTSPNYDEVGTVAYYALRLVEQFVAFCIPAFLFVSGYFVSVLVGRGRTTVDVRAIAARIRHMGVPYLFWTAVVLVGLAVEGHVHSVGRYVRMILTGASNPNYYYVPLLIQLYAVAPLVVRLARWNWKILLAATAALQVCVYAVQYPIVLGLDSPGVILAAVALPKWLFLVHLFWFSFGVVAGFEHQTLKPLMERVKWAVLPCVVCLFVLGVLEWEMLLRWSGGPWTENRITLIDGLYSGSILLAFLSYADVRLPFSGGLVALGGRSFGIYLAHGLVLEYCARGLYHLAPWVLGHQILLQPMLIVLGLAVPWFLMSLLSRSSWRGVYPYVFG